MADAFSQRLRLRLQQTGGNPNTWGGLLNAAALQLLEDAIAGQAQVTVTGDTTLSQNNGAQDQARQSQVALTGAPTVAFALIVPALSKQYLVINGTGQVCTVKTSAQTGGVAIAAGANQLVACDGTNVIAPNAASVGVASDSSKLGGIVAADYARISVPNQFTAGQAITFVTMADAATITLNALLGNNFYTLLGGNRTLVITNPGDGQEIEIWFQQDATGSRTMTWPGNVRFEGTSSQTLSVTPNTIDRFVLKYRAASNLFIARSSQGFSNPGTTSLVFSSNEADVCLFERAGSPGSVVTLNVTIAAGVTLVSTSQATPALDTSGFPSGSTINLINLGYILGRGGDGAQGAEGGNSGSSTTDRTAGKTGTNGGPAVKGPGAGRTLNVTNAAGFIWGGGGGGGGGGAQWGGGAACGNGGGGGGGAGGGRAGFGGASATVTGQNAANGTPGGAGKNGVLGAGGAGAGSGGTGGAGGSGGDWGAGGNGGTAVSGSGAIAAPGGASSAGKAIDVNAGGVNLLSGGGAPNIKGTVS